MVDSDLTVRMLCIRGLGNLSSAGPAQVNNSLVTVCGLYVLSCCHRTTTRLSRLQDAFTIEFYFTSLSTENCLE